MNLLKGERAAWCLAEFGSRVLKNWMKETTTNSESIDELSVRACKELNLWDDNQVPLFVKYVARATKEDIVLERVGETIKKEEEEPPSTTRNAEHPKPPKHPKDDWCVWE